MRTKANKSFHSLVRWSWRDWLYVGSEAAMAPLLAEAAAARAATDGSSAASEQGSDDAEVDEEEAVLSRFESAKGRPMIGGGVYV